VHEIVYLRCIIGGPRSGRPIAIAWDDWRRGAVVHESVSVEFSDRAAWGDRATRAVFRVVSEMATGKQLRSGGSDSSCGWLR